MGRSTTRRLAIVGVDVVQDVEVLLCNFGKVGIQIGEIFGEDGI